jgi:chemotaxis protein CheZ
MSKYSREQVMDTISSVMSKVEGEQAESLRHVRDELTALAKTIEDMHAEILATRSHDVSDVHIPTATDELDAVVGATEKASAKIMDSAEVIQGLAEKTDEATQKALMDETTKIFEACSFQDITGQRITKVVKTLRDIEGSVEKLLHLFGGKPVDFQPAEDTRDEDEKLKNAPQLEGQGVSQDDIDKLF